MEAYLQPRGAHVKLLTGMLVLFFGFEIWPNPIFLGWQIFWLFFWVSQNFLYFLGLTNLQLFFGSSNFCITHLNPLNEEHTVLKNKIIVAFHIFSNFDNHCILIHSIFLGLNFGAFYFFGV